MTWHRDAPAELAPTPPLTYLRFLDHLIRTGEWRELPTQWDVLRAWGEDALVREERRVDACRTAGVCQHCGGRL